MRAGLIRLLLLAYPRRWRREHGSQLSTILRDYPTTPAAVLDTVRTGLGERLAAAPGRYRTGIAALGFAAVDATAVHAGITENILWAPSTPERAVVLLVALLPLGAAALDLGRRRRRTARR